MTDNKKSIKRLLLLIGDTSNRQFADNCGFDEKVVRNIKNEVVPGRAVLEKIATRYNKTVSWILGEEEIRSKTESAEPKSDFHSKKFERESAKELSEIKREKFKRQCGSVYFDEFFDFIAETYGESREGAETFLNDYRSNMANSEFRIWLESKKEEGNNIIPEGHDNITANGQ